MGLHPYMYGDGAHPHTGLYQYNLWAQIPAVVQLIVCISLLYSCSLFCFVFLFVVLLSSLREMRERKVLMSNLSQQRTHSGNKPLWFTEFGAPSKYYGYAPLFIYFFLPLSSSLVFAILLRLSPFISLLILKQM